MKTKEILKLHALAKVLYNMYIKKKHGKIECDVRVEPGNGLGLPTLVIVPLGMPKWESGDVIKSTVTLKNKKVFTYSTELF